MAIDFTTLSVDAAKTLVEYPADRKAILEENREFVAGDHWQKGKGWIGPWPLVPEQATPPQSRLVNWLQSEIRKGFQSVNAIGEGVGRGASGTVGIEPRWGFAPTEVELPANAAPDSPAADEARQRAAAKAQRAEDLATRAWDRLGLHGLLQDAARRLLYGAAPTSEVAGRWYIPSAMLEDVTDGDGQTRKVLRVTSPENAIDKIRFELLDADEGRVVQDPGHAGERRYQADQAG